jgi:hypothetical protein
VTKITSFPALLATVVVCLLSAAPALAQRDRVFVASYGSDSNPCTFGSPCKTFQNAISVVAEGGEITAIDSAGFGTITISHAVTITSPNGVEAGIAAPAMNGAAITINAASSDIINLNGLTLDGAKISGSTGIQFNTGYRLNIRDSVIRNFATEGIYFAPGNSGTVQLSVSNTLVSDNGADAISIVPSGSGPMFGVLDHVNVENNGGNGLTISSEITNIEVTVTDSVIEMNQDDGIYGSQANPNIVTVTVKNSTIANNNGFGLHANSATIRVTRSTITGNAGGWEAQINGVIQSYDDNNIDGNGIDNTAPPAIGYK